MADLTNLLDEINNDEEEVNNDPSENDEISQYSQDDRQAHGQHSIPAALVAAANRQREVSEQLNERIDEEDYSSSTRKEALTDANENESETEDREGRIIDPEYEELKSLWCQELACPELMHANPDLVSLHVDLLAGQEETIEDLLQRSKQLQNQRRSGDDEISGELASLVAQITKMDLDRTRFMLVDLTRVRIAKIENHALHNRTMMDRMSEEEISYLSQYGQLMEKHFKRTVLNHFPKEAWKKLDETEMIDSPNLEEFVFCRVLQTVEIDVSSDNDQNVDFIQTDDNDFGDTVQEHHAGAYLIVMYKAIREHVLAGKVELLM